MKRTLLLFALFLCASQFLQAQCTDPYEPNDDSWQATGIAVPSIVYGQITTFEDFRDQDWYYISVPANKVVIAKLDNLQANLNITLYRNKPTWDWLWTLPVDSSVNAGTATENIIFQDGPAGDYFVKVYAPAPWGENSCYKLSVYMTDYPACPDNNEPNDEYASQTLTSSPINGRISESGDRDIFGIWYPNDQPYIKVSLTTSGVNDYGLEIMDSHRDDAGNFLQLYSAWSQQDSAGVSAYWEADERSPIAVVNASSSHLDCYSISVTSSAAPFAKSAAAVKVAQPAGQKTYPVPTSTTVYSVFNSNVNKQQIVTLTDMSGKVVYQQSFGVIAGSNKLAITIPSQLKDGVYILNNGVSAEKIVLQR